jgi:hypothetical protein
MLDAPVTSPRVFAAVHSPHLHPSMSCTFGAHGNSPELVCMQTAVEVSGHGAYSTNERLLLTYINRCHVLLVPTGTVPRWFVHADCSRGILPRRILYG